MRQQILELLNSGKFTPFHAVIAMIKIKRNVDIKINLSGLEIHEFADFLEYAVLLLFNELNIVTVRSKQGIVIKYY